MERKSTMSELLTGCLMHLDHNGGHQHIKESDVFRFDEPLWEAIVDEMAKAGQNALFMNLGNGLHYATHPELAVPGAWTRERLKCEIEKLAEKGITLMPKLNFSMMHGFWLNEYRRMPASQTYYRVCRELISEVARLFKGAKYFHLGMDEEDKIRIHKHDQLGIVRQNELYWHDLQFLLDCVRDEGLTPVIWASEIMREYDAFKQNISNKNLVLFHYHYHAVKKEHWTPVDSREDYKNFYSTREPYKYMDIKYVEEDPYYEVFRKTMPLMLEDGYECMVGVSTWYRNQYNTEEVLELYKNETQYQHLIKGYFMIPWLRTYEEYHEGWMNSIHELAAALEKFDIK